MNTSSNEPCVCSSTISPAVRCNVWTVSRSLNHDMSIARWAPRIHKLKPQEFFLNKSLLSIYHYPKCSVLWFPVHEPMIRQDLPFDCYDIFQRHPAAISGVYSIYPHAHSFSVFCDMDSENGGWTVRMYRKSYISYRLSHLFKMHGVDLKLPPVKFLVSLFWHISLT